MKSIYELSDKEKKLIDLSRELEKSIKNNLKGENIIDYFNFKTSPSLSKDLIQFVNRLEIKEILLGGYGWSIKEKKDFVLNIEEVIKFLEEKYNKAQQEKDADYYRYKLMIDDLKPILSLVHIVVENKNEVDYVEQVKDYPLIKKYSLTDDELKILDNEFTDKKIEDY